MLNKSTETSMIGEGRKINVKSGRSGDKVRDCEDMRLTKESVSGHQRPFRALAVKKCDNIYNSTSNSGAM